MLVHVGGDLRHNSLAFTYMGSTKTNLLVISMHSSRRRRGRGLFRVDWTLPFRLIAWTCSFLLSQQNLFILTEFSGLLLFITGEKKKGTRGSGK